MRAMAPTEQTTHHKAEILAKLRQEGSHGRDGLSHLSPAGATGAEGAPVPGVTPPATPCGSCAVPLYV